MQIGCQTIIFGRNIDNLDYVLASIANLGFTGVEFFQHPDRIFLYDPASSTFRQATCEDIVVRLQKYHLTFLGWAGGTIDERIAFCQRASTEKLAALGLPPEQCRPIYLYTEELEGEALQQAVEAGFNLAFHPHAFTKYERVEKAKADFDVASKKLRSAQNSERLFWLLDTAHMMVVGESPVATLQSLPLNKLIAIHLKAYNPAYGRSYHRYAKGFFPLNHGIAEIKEVIETMESRGFQGWYVVEQDFSHTDPVTSLKKSADWLIEQKYMQAPEKTFAIDLASTIKRAPIVPEELAKSLSSFITSLYRAGESNLEQCYHDIAKAIYHLLDATHITLWSWDQSRKDVCLLAAYPPKLQTEELPWKVNIDLSPLGQTRYPMQVKEMDIDSFAKSPDSIQFSYAAVARETDAQAAISMAIPNRYNPNAVRLLIGILKKEPTQYNYADVVELIADDIGCAVNNALDDTCATAAGKVSLIADQKRNMDDFLENLGRLIQKELKCEALTIFLTNRTGDLLEWRWGPSHKWREGLPENDKCYRKSETKHPTVQCWRECRTILLADAVSEVLEGDKSQRKSEEQVPIESHDQDNILIVPLVDVAKKEDGTLISSVIGVIRCRNKQKVARSE